MAPRTLRVVGALAASLAVFVLAGCAYTTAASTSSAPSATPAGLAGPVRAAAAPTPSSPAPAKPTARPVNHCARNMAAQAVLVSVPAQHAWMCDRTRVVYSAPVTTGAVDLPDRDTPTGTFRIQGKYTDQTLTLDTGVQYQVKYWIPFQGPLYGFHDSPWQKFAYGSARYRTQGSHGCVHLALPTIKFLYGWANVGTPVTITA